MALLAISILSSCLASDQLLQRREIECERWSSGDFGKAPEACPVIGVFDEHCRHPPFPDKDALSLELNDWLCLQIVKEKGLN